MTVLTALGVADEAAVQVARLACGSLFVDEAEDEDEAMERVHGIGGIFFRSRNPRALADWYALHLGVTPTPTTYDEPAWHTAAGPTVFEPFPEDSGYFGRAEQRWMLNFRVRHLDAMVSQLRQAGIEVIVDPQTYPNGRFARLSDPEGNPIELWQPAGRDTLPGSAT